MMTWREQLARVIRPGDLLVGVAAIVILAGAHAYGHGRRVFLGGTRIVRTDGGEDALRVWREAGVRGRILVHLGRKAAMVHAAGVSADSFVYRAIEENIVRGIYHVVPDAAWEEVAAKLRDFPEMRQEDGHFLFAAEGVPLVILRLADLPAIDEPVIVDLDVSRYSEPELAALAARVGTGALRPDLVSWYGAAALPAALDPLRAKAR